ncbi:hypothetical protein PHBOTO_000094 [Pseudozyma hubeiensis]|nr:hypothetical protein PHBOTO_000094 [Pseudozyma hubeiensis]
MLAETSQPPVASVPPTHSTSPYLAAAPQGLFAPPANSVLFNPSNQTQPQHSPQPQSSFVLQGASFPPRGFQDPSGAPNDAAYRVNAISRTAQVVDYTNPYQQIDQHIQHHQQPNSVAYNQHLYASTSYAALAGPAPMNTFATDMSSNPYAHPDMGMMPPNVGVPMMRYASFPMSADEMSRAGSSNGTPGPMTQQDIDNLLAMSRAQAGSHGDLSAFPCTYCDKVYTGKHARSIWRRHLQDKHNIPLSAQPRRTRWDGDVNRPKNAEERRARMLESKRRWARKKRLQEKQAAHGGKSGGSNTPMPDDSDDDCDVDGDDSADADVSNMEMTFSRDTDADDSLSFNQASAQAHIPRRASVKAQEASQWAASPEGQFFASQEEPGRSAKRQALAPSTAYNIAGPSSLQPHYPTQLPSGPYGAHDMASATNVYSSSPMHRGGIALAPVSQHGPGLPLLSNPNASFSSNSSDYSQPNSASFFNDSFAGNMSNSGSDSANTSIDTPATTWPSLPPLDGAPDKNAIARAVEGNGADAPRKQKGDTRDAAIQLLALRSGSNSPADDRDMSLRRRDAIEDAPWSSTPSRGKAITSDHAALTALSCSTAAEAGRKGGAVEDVGLSPSPISRALAASGANAVRAMPVTTPGPAGRSVDNPFSLDKHKISPYRKLSYSGAPVSPTGSPTHLTFGGAGMGKSLSSSGSTSTAGPHGVKLAPLVSTPIRPSSQGVHADAETGGERIKVESLPPLLGSASKKAIGGNGAPVMSTPFSKPMSGLGYSALRRGNVGGGGAANAHVASVVSSVRPSPSRHHSDDQFSSPQHLNLTESLGLAPHSISRTSSYASGCYASSLGLTPSVAGMSGGLISATPFHSGLGALSGLGGFTPFSTMKGAGGFWPESTRKSAGKLLGASVNSPTVYKSATQSTGASASRSTTTNSAGRKRKLSVLGKHKTTSKSRTASPVGGKGDIFDSDYLKKESLPSSDDTFGDDDDEEGENYAGMDTPSRPTAKARKLVKGGEERAALKAIRMN